MQLKLNPFLREANLIGGEWVSGNSGATIDVINPADGQKLGRVPKSGASETARAIEAAHEAFLSFRKTTALERLKLLRKLHDALMDNQQSLAELLTMEQGKSLTEAKGEIESSAAYILWFAEEVRRIYGDIVLAMDRSPHPRNERAGGRYRSDHALELPVVDAVAQDRPGACGRLHSGDQARISDAILRPCLGHAVRGGGLSPRNG